MILLYFKKLGNFRLIILLILLLIISISNYLLPSISAEMFNQMADNKFIFNTISAFIVISFITNVFDVVYNMYIRKCSNMVNEDLKNAILLKYLRLKEYEINENNFQSEIYTLYLEDTEKISDSGLETIFDLVVNIVKIVAIMFALFRIDIIFSIVIVGIGIIVLIYQMLFLKLLDKANNMLRKKYSYYYNIFENIASNRIYIALNKLVYHAKNKMSKINKRVLENFFSITKLINYSILGSNMLALLTTVIILLLYIKGVRTIEFGGFVVLLMYSNKLLSLFGVLPASISQIIFAKLSFKKVNGFLNFEETDGNVKIDSINSIELSDLDYRVNYNKTISYKNVFFEKGNIYIINGKNGSGKTTLMNLLTRELKPNKNCIIVNGEDVNSFIFDDYIEHISYSMQNNYYYDDIIVSDMLSKIENNPSLLKLCTEIDIMDFFESKKSIEKKKISGGERKKIELISQFIKEKDVIIIDELEADLDKKSIGVVYEYVKEIYYNKIVLIISHFNENNGENNTYYKIGGDNYDSIRKNQ